ncbi:23S rRNA (pseudouridine(1915)-N(3))-methyltransferase RlmH [bacterium]|nr:23S rRNA (pseudouridine(1915)-N(3))-methyltransferase RlmH [bacterium]PIV80402.1 MAG: 50S rRNA methyltransferase [bacterium CG17_big_fil_post_rev_8_21_14_2_50_64_8]PJA77098.1 MAG: 50S rRNA methyltransferase [bacterium CG_4_9_14_3_um_filter_65_15]
MQSPGRDSGMIRILAVGRMRDKRLAELAEDYSRRIGKLGKLDLTELRDSDPDREAGAMIAALGSPRGNQQVVALDEHGDSLDSREFSALLGGHGNICFLIGGPDGLGDEAKGRATLTVRLSAMTFTHEMARVLLLEQIYRGLGILAGHPYHRD